MTVHIKRMQPADAQAWDTYVRAHPDGTLYHLSGWKNIIRNTYNHKPFYLMAIKDDASRSEKVHSFETSHDSRQAIGSLAGVLPLIQIKSVLFGNKIISIPFFDIGGILADDPDTGKALIGEAIQLGKRLRTDSLELRQLQPLSFMQNLESRKPEELRTGDDLFEEIAQKCE
jgi:hypothetical protein